MSQAGSTASETQQNKSGGDMRQPGSNETTPGVAGRPYGGRTATPGVADKPTPQEMEQARSAAAKTSIWMFIALLIGAFCASLAATIGGRQRDSVIYYEVETKRGSGVITPESS